MQVELSITMIPAEPSPVPPIPELDEAHLRFASLISEAGARPVDDHGLLVAGAGSLECDVFALSTGRVALSFSDAAVADAHARSVAWHLERISVLRAMPLYADLYSAITSSRRRNLSRMATKFGANVHHLGPDVIPEDIANRDPDDDFFFTVELGK